MTDREKELTEQSKKLRADLAEAHDQLAKWIYKVGTIASIIGVDPELPDRELKAAIKERIAAIIAKAKELTP